MRGKFITLEGGEASGKWTNIRIIAEYLKNQGIPFVMTHEPGGTPLAEQLRSFLLAHHNEKIAPKTELLLMFASRAQHIHELILPALARGQWVICSRFTDSSYAYQGGGRGVAATEIKVLEDFVQEDLQPDLTLLLDLPVEIALERANRRGLLDRIEEEDRSFFERVRQVYLSRAACFPERFRIINADQSFAEVEQAIIKEVASINQSL